MKATIFSFLMLLGYSSFGAESFYYSVEAMRGDGIYSLLRRYHLDNHDCNKDRFLELNKLTIENHLIVGRKYLLPVLIYNYNGTSIRSTVGINDWDKAVRIKEYNDKILNDDLRQTHYTESKILWVPYHELHCDEALPAGSISEEKVATAKSEGRYRMEPLFGEKNKMVELVDNELAGKAYYVVAGHGGPDPGACCTDCESTMCEDEYAYDVALRLARCLMKRGATVHVIIQDDNDGIRDEKYLECDIDEKCMGSVIPLSQKVRLRQRASAINQLYKKYKAEGYKDQIAIMIHVDSYGNDKIRRDVYFYHHKTSKSSKKLADAMQNTFHEKYNYYQKNRGYKGFVSTRNLYMINYTLPTSVYVELANIRNKADQERLIFAYNREALAKWMYEGILDYHFK